MDALHWATLAQLKRGLDARDFSSLELTQHLLDRIAVHDERVQSFIHLADDALAQARAADRRRHRGGAPLPLGGIPIALKDNYQSRGMPTTAGTRATGIEFSHEVDSA